MRLRALSTWRTKPAAKRHSREELFFRGPEIELLGGLFDQRNCSASAFAQPEKLVNLVGRHSAMRFARQICFESTTRTRIQTLPQVAGDLLLSRNLFIDVVAQ